MPEASRTLILDYWTQQVQSPLCVVYSIIRCRLAGMGGFASGGVHAKQIDNHYLLMSSESLYSGSQPFGIVDLGQPYAALERMYREAKLLAESKAQFDENKVLDLTSRVKIISHNDSFYVPDSLVCRFSVR